MPKRNETNQKIIDAAREMPSNEDAPGGRRTPASDLVKEASAPVAGRAGAPSRLPGYKR